MSQPLNESGMNPRFWKEIRPLLLPGATGTVAAAMLGRTGLAEGVSVVAVFALFGSIGVLASLPFGVEFHPEWQAGQHADASEERENRNNAHPLSQPGSAEHRRGHRSCGARQQQRADFLPESRIHTTFI